MSDQFERYGVTDTYQLEEDVLIPRGTIVAIKAQAMGPWVLRADILRSTDETPRLKLPANLERALLASRDRKS